jgi:hypothetical protein
MSKPTGTPFTTSFRILYKPKHKSKTGQSIRINSHHLLQKTGPRLQQIETILSMNSPHLVLRYLTQINLAITIYCELHDMLDNAASLEGEFS